MECMLENITVYYESFGEGRPIIMLHGWPLDHHLMVSYMEPFFERRVGWKRIYPDLPGMGQTSGMDWINSQEQMLEIILAFIEKVVPGQRFVIAGQSYGGYLARGVLLRRADKMDGILLIVPAIRARMNERTLPPRATLVEDPVLISELESDEKEAFLNIAVVQNQEMLEAMRKDIFPAVARADQKFLSTLSENYAFSFDVDALDEPFAGPALFLMGRQDAICGYQDALAIVENYSRGTFAVLDRAGHGLGIEQRGLFDALVIEWLDRVEEYIKSE